MDYFIKLSSKVSYTNKICDVFASGRGPSCRLLSQIPSLKIIPVRFIDKHDDEQNDDLNSSFYDDPVFNRNQGQKRKAESIPSISSFIAPRKTVSHMFIDAILSIPCAQKSSVNNTIQMLDLTKLITKKPAEGKVSSFDIQKVEEKDFVNPVLMSIEKNSFASGGYRYCYKSTSCTISFNGKIWSIKKFNAAAKEYFASVRETGNFGYAEEDQAKKTVQMHSLAQYLALKYERKSKRDYGECFNYKRLFQAF